MNSYLWPAGTTGDYILYIDTPADLIDANVHPAKTLVKFIFPEIIESSISHLINNIISDQKKESPQIEKNLTSHATINTMPTASEAEQKKTTHYNSSLSLSNLKSAKEEFEAKNKDRIDAYKEYKVYFAADQPPDLHGSKKSQIKTLKSQNKVCIKNFSPDFARRKSLVKRRKKSV